MMIEYFMKFDLIIAFISLFTMLVLVILNLPVPNILFWIFAISLLLIVLSFALLRKTRDH